MSDATQLAVLTRARTKLADMIAMLAPSILAGAVEPPHDADEAAASFRALAESHPGSSHLVGRKSTTRTALEAAAFIVGKDSHPSELDRHLALRILAACGQPGPDALADAEVIARALEAVLGGAS